MAQEKTKNWVKNGKPFLIPFPRAAPKWKKMGGRNFSQESKWPFALLIPEEKGLFLFLMAGPQRPSPLAKPGAKRPIIFLSNPFLSASPLEPLEPGFKNLKKKEMEFLQELGLVQKKLRGGQPYHPLNFLKLIFGGKNLPKGPFFQGPRKQPLWE